MAPAPYLLHVNSRPTQVSDESWKEWYVKEHIPDLFHAGSCIRDTFYEEIPLVENASPDHPRKYLALYQTQFEELLKSAEYKGIRNSSEIFEKAGANSSMTQDNGDFDARYYKLLQEYDPNNIGEQVSPEIICVYMSPSDEEHFEKWYREEHLDLLSKVPGYRRSLRYKIGLQTPLTKGEPQTYLAIHEVDDVSTFTRSKEAEAANATAWTIKHIKESSSFVARAFRRISAEGY